MVHNKQGDWWLEQREGGMEGGEVCKVRRWRSKSVKAPNVFGDFGLHAW